MNLVSLIRSRWLPLLLASLLAVAAVDASAGSDALTTKPGKYGKTLLVDVVVPPSQVDQITAFLDALAVANHGTANSPVSGDTWDWVGDAINVKPEASPYTLVVQVTGRAKAAGDVLTQWKAGWRTDNNASKQTLMQGLFAADAKTGERVTLTAAAAPVRLDRDKVLVPVLSLIDARNITIDGVHVQLWSGLGGASWLEYLFAARWLLLGVVMLGVVLVFRRI